MNQSTGTRQMQLAMEQQEPYPHDLQEAATAGAAATGPTALSVFLLTVVMSAMAGFGAVPFFLVGKLKESWAGLANAIACGVMLTASYGLLHEGAPYSPTLVVLGMLLGAIFIK